MRLGKSVGRHIELINLILKQYLGMCIGVVGMTGIEEDKIGRKKLAVQREICPTTPGRPHHGTF
jgi:hypothetical protein